MADPFAQLDRGAVEWPGEAYGESVEGIPLRVWMPAREGPAPLILAAIHGNEQEATVVVSAALRGVPPAERRCAVILAANPDGALLGTRGNARGVDLNRNFATRNWGPILAEVIRGAAP